MDSTTAVDLLRPVARRTDGLRLLLLYGSRARDGAHARSDWDFGYLGDDTLDPFALLADVTATLGTDDVDVTNLDRASALLRFRAARDGAVIHEAQPGAYTQFVLDATLYWCDIEPVVRRAHRAVLAGLG
jgi:predicted nucleotidyltransferase